MSATRPVTEQSPLERELRKALGHLAGLAAQVELAKNLGEIDEETAQRLGRLAGFMGAEALKIGGVADVNQQDLVSQPSRFEPFETPAPHTNGNGNGNGHSHTSIEANGHNMNGNGNAHPVEPDHMPGATVKRHLSTQLPAVETKSDPELFIDIPELIKEHFQPEEYKTFSERDVAVAMHFLKHRGGQVSVKDMVNVLAPQAEQVTGAEYDAIRKGVSTSLKKLRTTDFGERCLKDNGQPTKARRYILLTDEEAQAYSPAQEPPTGQRDELSKEEQEALDSKREELFSKFLPCHENDPKGDTPCTVPSGTTLRVGNQTYEYQLTGKREGNKNTTVGMFNGLVELLVIQGKTEIKPGELTALLGLSGTGAVGRAFDNLIKNFDSFPFERTGVSRATRYFRNPDVYFTGSKDVSAITGELAATEDSFEHELTPPIVEHEETDALQPEVPEYPKNLELCEWGLSATLDQNETGEFTTTIFIHGNQMQLRDITVTTLLALVASRQSMLQSDLLQSVLTMLPDMTEEKLRGCLHEIRNSFEFLGVDKYLYQKQMPVRGGVKDTLLNINGIVEPNGVLDFLALSSVTKQ